MTTNKDKAFDILCGAVDEIRELNLTREEKQELIEDFSELINNGMHYNEDYDCDNCLKTRRLTNEDFLKHECQGGCGTKLQYIGYCAFCSMKK